MTRQLHLNLFIYPGGHHEAAWRHPDSSLRAPRPRSRYAGTSDPVDPALVG
ncbi:hypothetical protein GCM10010464_74910 [Pseudonocardia yunnanensis]|uniref:Uncharacterized protein n=1 Tax=Pseudonocardia yunnanensis TaxID=58107 RepID=A0ABW4F8A2_9PSEU